MFAGLFCSRKNMRAITESFVASPRSSFRKSFSVFVGVNRERQDGVPRVQPRGSFCMLCPLSRLGSLDCTATDQSPNREIWWMWNLPTLVEQLVRLNRDRPKSEPRKLEKPNLPSLVEQVVEAYCETYRERTFPTCFSPFSGTFLTYLYNIFFPFLLVVLHNS